LYCAVVGGLATLLTWRILLNLLRGVVTSDRLAAFLLSAPLTVLGIYCVFPHPFYDPDCTFTILLCIFLLQQIESKGFTAPRTFLVGAALVVPLFVKQNTGLAFLASTGLALAVLMGLEAWGRRPVRGYAWLLAGAAAGLVAALLLIELTAGLANYQRWTLQFAVSRRLPPLADMLAIYQDDLLPWWIATSASGALLVCINRGGGRVLALLAAALMSVPFVWTLVPLFAAENRGESVERLLALWPFLLSVSSVVALGRLWSEWRRPRIALALPFILIGTVHGAFLSQQVWGSSYGLWPLLILLIVSTTTVLVTPPREWSAWWMVPFAVRLDLIFACS
jgi:hypothetical protein